jgi:putative DNA primase/helicase
MSTIERARGRWCEILPQLGIDAHFLRNRHGPCPLCGGKDRFRFDDRDGTGSYFCNQCGAGVGVILVRKKHGWNFKTAADAIDNIIGTDPPRPPRPAPPPRSPASRLAKIERVLGQATDQRIVESYLTGRGLTIVPKLLRGHRGLWHAEAERKLPVVVAPVLGPDGTLQSAQRIYLGDVEPLKKTMPAVDTIRGGAVRLFDPADATLGVAEGIETAIATHELFGIATWAALSTTGFDTFEPPAGLRRLVIFADNDTNYAGQKAAYALASRQARTIEVEVKVPLDPDTDWLDVLNQRRRNAEVVP